MLVLRSSALGRSSSSALGACAIANPATPNVVIATVIAATVTTRMIRFTADVPPSSRCAFSLAPAKTARHHTPNSKILEGKDRRVDPLSHLVSAQQSGFRTLFSTQDE